MLECGLPRLVRTVGQIRPQRLEELAVHCPESLSPFGMPLSVEFSRVHFFGSAGGTVVFSSAMFQSWLPRA